jgi:hypothetical protein
LVARVKTGWEGTPAELRGLTFQGRELLTKRQILNQKPVESTKKAKKGAGMPRC